MSCDMNCRSENHRLEESGTILSSVWNGIRVSASAVAGASSVADVAGRVHDVRRSQRAQASPRIHTPTFSGIHSPTQLPQSKKSQHSVTQRDRLVEGSEIQMYLPTAASSASSGRVEIHLVVDLGQAKDVRQLMKQRIFFKIVEYINTIPSALLQKNSQMTIVDRSHNSNSVMEVQISDHCKGGISDSVAWGLLSLQPKRLSVLDEDTGREFFERAKECLLNQFSSTGGEWRNHYALRCALGDFADSECQEALRSISFDDYKTTFMNVPLEVDSLRVAVVGNISRTAANSMSPDILALLPATAAAAESSRNSPLMWMNKVEQKHQTMFGSSDGCVAMSFLPLQKERGSSFHETVALQKILREVVKRRLMDAIKGYNLMVSTFDVNSYTINNAFGLLVIAAFKNEPDAPQYFKPYQSSVDSLLVGLGAEGAGGLTAQEFEGARIAVRTRLQYPRISDGCLYRGELNQADKQLNFINDPQRCTISRARALAKSYGESTMSWMTSEDAIRTSSEQSSPSSTTNGARKENSTGGVKKLFLDKVPVDVTTAIVQLPNSSKSKRMLAVTNMLFSHPSVQVCKNCGDVTTMYKNSWRRSVKTKRAVSAKETRGNRITSLSKKNAPQQFLRHSKKEQFPVHRRFSSSITKSTHPKESSLPWPKPPLVSSSLFDTRPAVSRQSTPPLARAGTQSSMGDQQSKSSSQSKRTSLHTSKPPMMRWSKPSGKSQSLLAGRSKSAGQSVKDPSEPSRPPSRSQPIKERSESSRLRSRSQPIKERSESSRLRSRSQPINDLGEPSRPRARSSSGSSKRVAETPPFRVSRPPRGSISRVDGDKMSSRSSRPLECSSMPIDNRGQSRKALDEPSSRMSGLLPPVKSSVKVHDNAVSNKLSRDSKALPRSKSRRVVSNRGASETASTRSHREGVGSAETRKGSTRVRKEKSDSAAQQTDGFGHLKTNQTIIAASSIPLKLATSPVSTEESYEDESYPSEPELLPRRAETRASHKLHSSESPQLRAVSQLTAEVDDRQLPKQKSLEGRSHKEGSTMQTMTRSDRSDLPRSISPKIDSPKIQSWAAESTKLPQSRKMHSAGKRQVTSRKTADSQKVKSKPAISRHDQPTAKTGSRHASVTRAASNLANSDRANCCLEPQSNQASESAVSPWDLEDAAHVSPIINDSETIYVRPLLETASNNSTADEEDVLPVVPHTSTSKSKRTIKSRRDGISKPVTNSKSRINVYKPLCTEQTTMAEDDNVESADEDDDGRE